MIHITQISSFLQQKKGENGLEEKTAQTALTYTKTAINTKLEELAKNNTEIKITNELLNKIQKDVKIALTNIQGKQDVQALENTTKELVIADITKTKKELYKIIDKNSIVKHIPDKMKEEVSESSAEYRIYFNNLDPIIYVELVDGQVDMYMRFLVHPKKQRNIENSIWLDILKANNDGIIQLSKK